MQMKRAEEKVELLVSKTTPNWSLIGVGMLGSGICFYAGPHKQPKIQTA